MADNYPGLYPLPPVYYMLAPSRNVVGPHLLNGPSATGKHGQKRSRVFDKEIVIIVRVLFVVMDVPPVYPQIERFYEVYFLAASEFPLGYFQDV
jgi:hypothetical protein